MRVTRIRIKRFRCINDMTLQLDAGRGLVTICGENNTGKTNTLRAIALFFDPARYDAAEDAPYHKFYGSRGQTVFPEIEVSFDLGDKGCFKIRRAFDLQGLGKSIGWEVFPSGSHKRHLSDKEIRQVVENFMAPLIEVANVSLPEIISELISDVYDIEFANARFRGAKKQLKEALEGYRSSLLEIMNESLASEIEPLLRGYNRDWGVRFDIDDVTRFRDLITDEIRFVVDDRSGAEIAGKGSGLQRLAALALYFYISKHSRKRILLLIDEPDGFLHHGLQQKLAAELRMLAEDSQVFITTHSPVFIDSASLRNVFLLDMRAEEKPYKRRNRSYYALDTFKVNLDEMEGAKQIRAYLGVSEHEHDVLDRYNVLVEGDSDVMYLEELLRYFELPRPRLVSVNGIDKVRSYLEFYNSYYESAGRTPTVAIMCDNDGAGRNVYNSLCTRSYAGLNVKWHLVPTHRGDENAESAANWEIEDLLYPEVMCELANRFLAACQLQPLDAGAALANLAKPSFRKKGILYILEYEKNRANPDSGVRISFEGTAAKTGIAKQLQLQGDKVLSDLMRSAGASHPAVESFLRRLVDDLKSDQGRLIAPSA